MPAENDIEIPMAGGKVSSTVIAGYHLIPTEALRRYAERCDAGVARKGKQAWNAITADPAVTTDREFILHRIGHVIIHAMKLRDRLVNNLPLIGDGIDDDAGAMIWAAGFLCCATRALQDSMDAKALNCSACGGDGKVHSPCFGEFECPEFECPACKGTGKQNS